MNGQKIILKIIALFSVVRGYNLIVLILAQYLAALFIFAPEIGHRELLPNARLDAIILCSILCVAAGYIINNFYDLEKDELKRPLQVYLQKQVSQGFKLTVYIILNTTALIIAALILVLSIEILSFFSLALICIFLGLSILSLVLQSQNQSFCVNQEFLFGDYSRYAVFCTIGLF